MEGKNKKVRNVLLMILILNFVVAALKLIFGSIIDSASLTADGFHSFTDGFSNVIGIIGIWLASKPEDYDHPYGHKKFESLASLFIAGMLLFMAIRVIIDGINGLFNPVMPRVSIASLIVLVITLIINIAVAAYENKRGRELNSEILIADSYHTRSDIYISSGVLLTLILIKYGMPVIVDPVMSLIVAGFILHAAYEIFIPISGVLLDRAIIDPEKIKDVLQEFEDVKDCHEIRSRGKDDIIYLDLHILTDPDLSVEASHKLTHNIEERLNQELKGKIQVLFHVEPYDGLEKGQDSGNS